MTEKMKNFLKKLDEVNGNISKACKAVGIDRKTFYNWKKTDDDFRDKAEEIIDKILDDIEDVVYTKALEGDLKAAFFVLKTKGKKRGWSEKDEADNTTPFDLPYGQSIFDNL